MSHGGGETIGVRGGTIGGDARTEEEANKKQRSQKRNAGPISLLFLTTARTMMSPDTVS